MALLVSRKISREKEVTAPTAITIIQIVHRHPLACAVKLPTAGAATGPSKGSTVATDIAAPRFSFTNKSPTILGPSVRDVITKPFRKRNVTSIEIFVLKAEPTEHRRNSILPMWYTGSRPYNSEDGATRNGPMPSPNSQMDTSRVEYSLFSLLNSSRTCGTAGTMVMVANEL